TLSQRNAEISLRAMELGAVDYIPKPSVGRLGGSEEFRRELLAKVRLFGRKARDASPNAGANLPQPATAKAEMQSGGLRRAIGLRAASELTPTILAIGSSTGGPQALRTLLTGFPIGLDIPIVITQHMPPTFTTILAQHLAKASGWESREAVDGE